MKCKHCGEEIELALYGAAYIHKDGYYTCSFQSDYYATPKED